MRFHRCPIGALTLLLCPMMRAAIVASDTFTYPDGGLPGNNGGSGWFSAWGGTGMDVISGRAVTNVFNNPPKYGSRIFNNPASTNTLFVRFDLFVPNTLTVADYLGCQLSIGANNNILLFGKDAGSSVYQVGNTGLVSSSIPVVPGSQVVLVGAYYNGQLPGTDLQLLWVNPDGSDFFDPSTGMSSADAIAHELVAFDAATVTLFGGIPGIGFDNLVISNMSDGVGITAVPEPGTVFALAAGVVVLLRSRSVPPPRRRR